MSKFKVGDIVIGTSDGGYSTTTVGWIGRVVQTTEHTVALVDFMGQDPCKYFVTPKHFELYPPAQTRLWRIIHDVR